MWLEAWIYCHQDIQLRSRPPSSLTTEFATPRRPCGEIDHEEYVGTFPPIAMARLT